MKRRSFLTTLAMAPLASQVFALSNLGKLAANTPKTQRWPVIFIGHGNPLNALLDNSFTQSLQALGQKLGKPKAVIVVSAHWETAGTYVASTPKPNTMHDFGRIDDRLFKEVYPASGSPTIAKLTAEMGQHVPILTDDKMGLDHGAWTVLKFLYPKADVPVFELSLDYRKGPAYHFKLGQELSALREKGVLILGSGNIVHNLSIMDWEHMDRAPFPWAEEFDTKVKKLLDSREFKALVNYQSLGSAAGLAVPSNEHFMPLMYILGLSDNKDELQTIYEGYQHGSISMRCVAFGPKLA